MSNDSNVIHVGNFALVRLQREVVAAQKTLDAVILELREYGVPEEEIEEILRDDFDPDEELS